MNRIDQHSVSDTSAVAISPAGNLLTAGVDGIKEWSEAGELLGIPWSVDGSSCTLSNNGRLAAIRTGDDTKLVAIAIGSTIREFPNSVCVLSENSEFIISTRKNVEPIDIQIWRIANGVVVPFESALLTDVSPFAPAWDVTRASLSPDGKSLLYRGLGPYAVTALLEGRQAPNVWLHSAHVTAGVWHPNGKVFATGHYLGDVRLRLVDDPDHYVVVRTHGRRIHSIAFTPDG